jgi:glycosyltransferase involved in cell wall biosynthesis
LRIVIVDTTIDEDLIGGAHLFLPVLIKGLVANGNEVHLVTKGPPNNKVAAAINKSGAILHTTIWNNSWYVEKTAPKLAEWVNKQAPDVYLISASGDIGWVVLPLLNPDIATLTIGHTDSETFYLPARHYHSFLTGAVGVSEQVCKQYAESCSVNSERVAWIPYGVQAAEEVIDYTMDKKLRLVYAGRIEEEQKRISDLAKIINKLSGTNIDFTITIVGDGPQMPELKKSLVNEINLNKAVLTGWLPNEEVIKIFRQSEVFVLTSAYEGFCIALTEAMANGCCPVVTNIRSGNGQLIQNGSNGIIHEIGDVDAFVAALIELNNNPAKLLTMRTKAWQAAYEYGTQRMVDNYEKLFVEAMAAAKKNLRSMAANFSVMETCRSKHPFWLRSIKAFFKSIRA